ncbi:putative membrane protein [Candidatus Phytoplasma solani]
MKRKKIYLIFICLLILVISATIIGLIYWPKEEIIKLPEKFKTEKANTIYLNLTKKENSIEILNDYIIFEDTKLSNNPKYFYNNEGKITSLQYYNSDNSKSEKCNLIYQRNGRIKQKECYNPDGIYEKNYIYKYNKLGQIITKEEDNLQTSNNFKYEYIYNDLHQLTYLQQYFPNGVTGVKLAYVYKPSN